MNNPTRHILISLALIIMLYQGNSSYHWMHYQAAHLAPIQAIRARVGDWLEQNADRTRPVLSGDLGSLAYHAPDIRFIDTIGLTSSDVLDAYRRGENLDAIIIAAHPQYIADTFTIEDGVLVYAHGSGSFVRNGKPSTIPPGVIVWGEQVGPKLAIAIVEIKP